MGLTTATVRVPASTANLGPGFDCLALALDLWNEARFELTGDRLVIDISGEGEKTLARNERNLVYRTFKRVYDEVNASMPEGLCITCRHEIPLGSGLGSSAAAALAGLLGANALLGGPLKPDLLLQMGADLEGHADNLAASMDGGLVLVTRNDWCFEIQKLECPSLLAVFVLPEIRLSTHQAREALPKQVPLQEAVFNIGQSIKLVEALRGGDIDALTAAMQDKLHQPHRLPLIPGAAEALEAAHRAGAAAALSGAGPGLIAFVEEGREKAVAEALRAPFAERGVKTRQYLLRSTERGAAVAGA